MPQAARRRLSRISVAASATALIAGSLALAAPAAAASAAAPTGAARRLAGTHPAWATASADRGAASANSTADVRVYLAGQDPAGLAAYARAVSDPASPQYGRYLTPAQARARFGASAAQVDAVHAWLAGSGLRVGRTTAHYVEVSGTTAALEKAFGTRIHTYRTGGGVHRAPASDAVLPGSVAGAVLGVSGLSDTVHKAVSQAVPVDRSRRSASLFARAASGVPAQKGLPTVPTCSAKYGERTAKGAPAGYEANEPFAPCSYTPKQLREAYGVNDSGLTGRGAKVAVIDAYGLPTMAADASHFATAHGDRAFRAGQYTEYMTPGQWTHEDECGGPAGWAGEEALDVEMVHGLAPDAQVVYVGGNSCYDGDLYDAMAKVVDEHLADVVTNSWGEIMHSTAGDIDPAVVKADEQVFMLGAAEGIGFTFSTGDCGDDSPGAAATGVNCDPTTTRAQTQWPASSVWVTGVGGTALGTSSSRGRYGFETSMGDRRSVLSADQRSWNPFPGRFYFGGGGGTSEDFAQPWYQKGVVPASVSTTLMTGAKAKRPMRTLPDVSMNGDLVTSVLVGYDDGTGYGEGGYGGTSVSSPEYAGLLADAIQARHGRAVGFANPGIYDQAGTSAYHDVDDTAVHAKLGNVVDLGVVDGSLRVRLYRIGADFGLRAVRGYDTATGVGSPAKDYLTSYLPRR
ncbi:protease pro-enzyme activation domain-containing protein [Streptomyces sp. NPDC001380]|uniref:S53 family peptidase n=1 Tax=Streptomyces sp. NPDC001380 TaxID=3364566 RepID=UPI0036BC5F14